FALHTMGFRGEALASIAAVAQVELKTRKAEDELGTHLSLSGSKVLGQEPVACPVGSNFLVENLFFNVPARRKFLKSNATELNNILTAFERIVLVNPQIGFTFYSNRTELFNLRPCALRQRIIDVFGKKVNQDLLPVEVETTVCKISGFVGKPESAKKKGAYQFFFVNGRYMKHPYFHKAVQNAFERLVPAGEQVPYFIYFDVPAEDIDVNIHPTKTEIKFENEQTIWQILMAAVREAVGKFNDVPSIDFDTVGKPEIPVFNPSSDDVKTPHLRVDPQYNPFKQQTPTWKQSSVKDWEQLYEGLERQEPEQTALFPAQQEEQEVVSEKSFIHYQYKGCYIMTAVKSGLMIIDQHRAHVRILYDQYIQLFQSHSSTSQKMLFPEVVQFPPSEAVVLEKVIPEMEHLGFELTDLGNRSYAINAVPTGLDGVNMVNLVQSMVASAVEQGKSMSEEIHHALAVCLARCAAIPRGQVLSNEEMEEIVNQLFACKEVNYTPDGKPVLSILKQEDIEHLF
ncbi:MAG: DNA mismatch repair protein MutL, partial [Prevotella sp.]|nr:DNA mismatch repair protein MutL [Prevotella sp.]